MAYFRGIAIVLAACTLIGCDLLTAGEAVEDRTLYPLQNAIEATLAEDPSAAAATGDAQHPAAANENAGQPAEVAPPNSEPVADVAPDGHAAEDTPPIDNAAEDSLPNEQTAEDTPPAEYAAADATPAGQSAPGEPAESAVIPSGRTAAVAVVAVVDSYFLKTPNAEDTEVDPVELENARRRERVTRQEIQDSLVKNMLIDALPRDLASETKAREAIIANNSAELSAALAAEIGLSLTAQIVICVLIDEAGHEVNIVAQQTTDAKLIYQETIMDWKPVIEAIAAPKAE